MRPEDVTKLQDAANSLLFVSETLNHLRFASSDQNPKGIRDLLCSAAYAVKAVADRAAPQQPLEPDGFPQPPWPIGADTNCKREGWRSYFLGKPRNASPFPPSRDDLRSGYAEGWDTAARAHPQFPLTIDTIFAYLNDREARPYEVLRDVGVEPIPEVEVTEEVFSHFLNILPPVLMRGGGFYVIERITDDTVSSYYPRGDKFFHRYIDSRKAAR